jgi:hypothetical protein
MASPRVKTNWLGGRVSDDFKEEVEAYLDAVNEQTAAEMTQGDLIRVAVAEYIKNHPAKEG